MIGARERGTGIGRQALSIAYSVPMTMALYGQRKWFYQRVGGLLCLSSET